MKKLLVGAIASVLLAIPAVAEGPVKEPSLVEQIATLTNELNIAKAALDEANLENARQVARYKALLKRYNEKAKKYKFAQIKG